MSQGNPKNLQGGAAGGASPEAPEATCELPELLQGAAQGQDRELEHSGFPFPTWVALALLPVLSRASWGTEQGQKHHNAFLMWAAASFPLHTV